LTNPSNRYTNSSSRIPTQIHTATVDFRLSRHSDEGLLLLLLELMESTGNAERQSWSVATIQTRIDVNTRPLTLGELVVAALLVHEQSTVKAKLN